MLYIDVYFIINWVMNLLVLLLTGILYRNKPLVKRYSMAAAVGAVWAVLPYITKLPSWIFSWGGELVIAVCMCKIAYQCQGGKRTIVTALRLYAVTWCIGGALNAIYYQTEAGVYIRYLIYGESFEISVLWLFATAIFVASGFVGASWWYRHESRKDSLLYPVELCFQEKKVELKGLLDTGNRLYTMTGKPVSVMGISVLEQLSKEKAEWIKYYLEGTLEEMDTLEGIMLIPFQSVGNSHGMMPVIWIDTMTIKKNTSEEVVSKPALGISKPEIFLHKEYQLILHQSYGQD